MELSAPYSLSRRVPSATRPPLPDSPQCKASLRHADDHCVAPPVTPHPSRGSASVALSAVARILSAATGERGDPRDALLREARGLLGATAAFLILVNEAERCAKVVAGDLAEGVERAFSLADEPAFADALDGGLPAVVVRAE